MDENETNIISLEAFAPQQQEAPAPVAIEPRQKRKYTKRKKGPRKQRVSKASAPTTAHPVPAGVVTFEGQGPVVSLSPEAAGPAPLRDPITRYIAAVFKSNHAPLPAIVREPDGALLIEPDYTPRYAAFIVLAAILAGGWWLAWNWF